MLMKIEHGNLRATPAPLPRVARATSPTRWATCPAEDRDRQIGVPAHPSGWGQLSTSCPFFHPSPENRKLGSACWCAVVLPHFAFCPLWKKCGQKTTLVSESLDILSFSCVRPGKFPTAMDKTRT